MERIDGNVRAGGVREVLGIEVPFSLAAKLSRASKLEVQIGLYEFELKPEQIAEIKMASQSIPSWNQIISWLREMETLRTVAA